MDRIIEVWVNWDEHYIADSYEDAVDYARNCGMIDDFDEWLDDHYCAKDIFEMTEIDKAKIKIEYKNYVRREMEDEWLVKTISI